MRTLKLCARWLLFYLCRLFWKPSDFPRRPRDGVYYLSDRGRATFFGYHDKTPFSTDGSRVLASSVAADDTDAKSECTLMQVGYFERNAQGDWSPEFHIIGTTNTWCWQQGCMLQWHPTLPSHVIYNTLVDGQYGSVIQDIAEKRLAQSFEYPVYSLSPRGDLAATLNFSRLGRLRPGYGYGLLSDTTSDFDSPDDDGLFLFNLTTSNRRLCVSLGELAGETHGSGSQHYVNHATFSPDGTTLAFFHLWLKAPGSSRRCMRMLTLDTVTHQRQVIEQDRIVSHYCWLDNSTILATTRTGGRQMHYTLYDLKNNKWRDTPVNLGKDGHPMFHPLHKHCFVTDTYPDLARRQHVIVVDLRTRQSMRVASLSSPIRYGSTARCDLHPRWDRTGQYIAVDSTAPGRRCLLVLSAPKAQNS